MLRDVYESAFLEVCTEASQVFDVFSVVEKLVELAGHDVSYQQVITALDALKAA